MHDLIFAPDAFRQYIDWQTEDKKTLKRINLLISDIQRNGFMLTMITGSYTQEYQALVEDGPLSGNRGRLFVLGRSLLHNGIGGISIAV
jgi:hypothetical protein